MTEPKLSIIVPVYNVEAYLEECVHSLLAQTYQELEVILIDDGSKDGSGALCDSFAQTDERIVVIHQVNQGVSAARNAGLRAAHGAYIGFVDADDWIEPDMYGHMIALMEADGTDAAFCGYWEDYEDGGIPPVCHAPERTGKVTQEEAIYQCLIATDLGYYIIGCNKCFRRELIWPNGKMIGFPEKLPRTEDELWLSQVLCNLNSASLTNRMFYHWRLRAASASHVLKADDSFYAVMDAHEKAAAYFTQIPGCRDLALGRIYDVMFRCVWVAYYVGNREIERTIRKRLKPYRKVFWKCREFSLVRKGKLLVVDWICILHFPKKWVSAVEQATF